MPRPTKSKTHFDNTDCNKVRVGDRGKDCGKGNIWCILCNRKVIFDHSSMAQINQHCRTAEHWKLSMEKFKHPNLSSPKLVRPLPWESLLIEELMKLKSFGLSNKRNRIDLFEARITLVSCSSEWILKRQTVADIAN